VVIGAHDRIAAQAVADLYAPLQAPVVFTDPVTAELSKLAANAFLATKISFANVLSRIGEAVGADGEHLSRAISLDPRIGHGHLRAGLGFGGSCLPKDLAAMETLARRVTGSSELFSAVAAVNRAQRIRITDLLTRRLGRTGSKRVAILGASFKANTDDLRDSPALALARELNSMQARVAIYDPAVNGELRELARGWLAVNRSPYSAVRGADALIVATEWPEFAALDFARVKQLMRGTLVIDGRGILNASAIASLGFDFFSFARGDSHPEPITPPAAAATA
jgi:UDPglucose 6-dehydrogenase